MRCDADGSCVLIDFGTGIQSNCAFDGELNHDYDDVLHILCEESGIDPDLVKANFAPKERWDFTSF